MLRDSRRLFSLYKSKYDVALSYDATNGISLLHKQIFILIKAETAFHFSIKNFFPFYFNIRTFFSYKTRNGVQLSHREILFPMKVETASYVVNIENDLDVSGKFIPTNFNDIELFYTSGKNGIIFLHRESKDDLRQK
jgi:hypothetical protein